MHTGIGYWFHEDKYKNGTEQVTRQNQVYSELGYGSRNGWEITARVGMSDLKLIDAFSSSTASTATSKKDFEEHGKFFGTLGAKGFYPFNKTFGMGAFIQGTYYFSDFTDTVSGTRNGVPFSAELRVKNLWDVNFGMGFQVTVPHDIKLYIGPYVHYSEFKVSPSADVAGLASGIGGDDHEKQDRFRRIYRDRSAAGQGIPSESGRAVCREVVRRGCCHLCILTRSKASSSPSLGSVGYSFLIPVALIIFVETGDRKTPDGKGCIRRIGNGSPYRRAAGTQ